MKRKGGREEGRKLYKVSRKQDHISWTSPPPSLSHFPLLMTRLFSVKTLTTTLKPRENPSLEAKSVIMRHWKLL